MPLSGTQTKDKKDIKETGKEERVRTMRKYLCGCASTIVAL
jgi:hypothetical protein